MSTASNEKPPDDEYFTECFIRDMIIGEVYVTFNRQPTAESKFLYTYNMLKKYKKLPTPTAAHRMCDGAHVKNTISSQTQRSGGNAKFRNRDYRGAYEYYNRSVNSARVDSPDYALALANRSAALYHLDEYDFCVVDVHRALAANYPEQLTYKLCDREIKCLVKTGRMSQAKLKFDELPIHLARSNLSEKQKKFIENENVKMLSTRTPEKTTDQVEKLVIKLLGGSNKSIPSLSKYVQLKYSESMGRSLYVSTDVKPGDVLAIEKPYAGVPRLELSYNCRYCFKLCLSSIPCLTCSLAVYCNESCRLKSYESGHKYECQVLAKFYSLPCMDHMEHLSLYIVLTAISNFGLDNYVDTVRALNTRDTDPVTRGFGANGKLLSNEFCSVYTLEGNESKRTVTDLFLRYCYAAVLTALLPQMEIQIPVDQLGVVGASIVHILCVVASNAHGITQSPCRKRFKFDVKSNVMPVASLLMPVLSLLNHNCDPNVVRHNYNGTIVLRAIQPIPKNSQLFDNYGQLYATHEKLERQRSLSDQYCFHCNCLACVEDWPVFRVLEEQKPLIPVDSLAPAQQNRLKTLSHQLYVIVRQLKLDNSDCLEHVEFLYSYLTFLHFNLTRPWRDYCVCQETIKEVLYRTSNMFTIEYVT